MKKILSFLAVSALLIPFMQGCDENKTKPEQKEEDVELSISASKEVYPGPATFTVSAETAPAEDLTITVESSDEAVISVPATITLKAGERSVKGDYTAKTDGTATLTISNDKATITNKSVSITVLKDIAEIVYLSPDNPDVPTASANNVWVPMSGQGGFYYHSLGWDGNGNSQNKLSYDLYGGDVVGEQKAEGIVFKAVEKDTPIDDKLSWLKTGWENDGKDSGTKYTCMPYVAIEGGYTAGNGEIYLVCTLPVDGKGTSVFAKAWVKVKIDPTAMTLTFIEGAMCTNDVEFKVGQTE